MRLAGLDLGKVRDFTALVVAEKRDNVYRLERISEWQPLEEDLGDVVPIVNACGADVLAYDAGGKPGKKLAPRLNREAGMPVYSLLATHQRKAAEQPVEKKGLIFVAKAELVRNYIAVLTQRRFCYPRDLPNAWKLAEQIRLYQESRDPVYGHTSWGAPPGCHDDVLSALQILLWLGECGLSGEFKAANGRETR